MNTLHTILDRFEAWKNRNENLYFWLFVFGFILTCSIADTMMMEQPIIIAEQSK